MLLAAVEARAQRPAIDVDRDPKVPKGLRVPGKTHQVVGWRDAKGDNLAVFSAKEWVDKGQGYDGGDRRNVVLYMSHFLLGKKPQLVRRITDYVKECDWDEWARFLNVGQEDITDLDGDGIAEHTIAYHLGCRSDLSPLTLKVLLLEHGEKYAIRGTTRIDPIDCGCSNGMGGDQEVDPHLQKNAAFLAHAQKVWNKVGVDPVSTPDRKRDTARLFTAVQDSAMTKALLDRGADVNGIDEKGRPLLHAAVAEHSLPVVQLLLSRGANVNATDKTKRTALHVAAGPHKGYIVDSKVAALLLEHGAELLARDRDGITPVHLAARHQLRVLELLLARGADINVTDNDGWTPLHFTITSHNVPTLKLLLERKANSSIRTKKGREGFQAGMTAYEMALQDHEQRIQRNVTSELLPVFRSYGIPKQANK